MSSNLKDYNARLLKALNWVIVTESTVEPQYDLKCQLLHWLCCCGKGDYAAGTGTTWESAVEACRAKHEKETHA